MNRYPLWKYALIVLIIAIGAFYALPNIYGRSPVVQISAIKSAPIDENLIQNISDKLNEVNITDFTTEIDNDTLVVRFNSLDDQFNGKEVLNNLEDYKSALNLKPNVPDWLSDSGGKAMNLGLDLRGGVHFLMEVDMEEALDKKFNQIRGDITQTLSKSKIPKKSIRWQAGINSQETNLVIKFRTQEHADEAYEKIRRGEFGVDVRQRTVDGDPAIVGTIKDIEIQEIQDKALEQNISTIRSRVNEFGVAEPIVQREGANRIVVQLPGVQDSSEIKDTLGTVATLEYRAVNMDPSHNAYEIKQTGKSAPLGYKLYEDESGNPVLLSKRIIVSGDQLIDATAGTDQQTGQPQVSVRLNKVGAKRMLDFTKDNVGNNMAVVFKTREAVSKDPETNKTIFKPVETVISNATIRGVFSDRFQTSGSMTSKEAAKLALLLRAGALAAPVEIVAERTVGPSLGQENIDKGFNSVVIGFVLVLVFMLIYYRLFGVVANVALACNVVLMVAMLSIFGATLTLPGIAGIVLTVGMAVDANVLIFERIKEELASGNTPQGAINAGYGKALSTIADANITTFIAAVVLFAFGTGPIKGFAVTLSIGILTSMFTAIMLSRALVNLIYGNRPKIKTLSI